MKKKTLSKESDCLSIDKIHSRFFKILEWYNYDAVFSSNEDVYTEHYGFELNKIKKKLKSSKAFSKLKDDEYDIAVDYLMFDAWYYGNKKAKKILDKNIDYLTESDLKFYNDLWNFSPEGMVWVRKKEDGCTMIIIGIAIAFIAIIVALYYLVVGIIYVISHLGDYIDCYNEFLRSL